MKLSVIVPIYNSANVMEGTIRSLLAQPIEQWELILVDDGSTDGSGAICDTFAAADSRIRVLHQENKGVAAARNTGLAAARGKYIGFADSDDSIKPQMFQKLLDCAEHNQSDMVMGGYEKVYAANQRDTVHIPFENVLTDVQSIKNVAWSMAFWNGYLEGKQLPAVYGSVWPNLYRAEFLRKYLICFPEGVRIGEDLLFNLDVIYHAENISVVDEPLYEYNVANTSATRKKNPQLWNCYTELLQLEAEKLTAQYGESDELDYNFHRQTINYAINVAEEQICVFYKGNALHAALYDLCSDARVQKAAIYIVKYGKTLKERLQAMLIRGKRVRLIRLWLTR